MAGLLEIMGARAEKVLHQAGLSPEGAPLLVAVSGGCDSVALLHVLLELGYPVALAHVDHGTRGGDSRADAVFVTSLAEGLDLACHVCRHDVPAEARAARISVEQQGRAVRYAFFAATAQDNGYAAIVTGHHADDQAETVLLRMLRGSSPEGLAGIAPVRPLDGIPLVRPLLGCRREELEACAEAEGWVYRTDATNADEHIPRNRVRHGLIPHLAEHFNPAIVDALGRLAAVQRVQEAFMAPLVAESYAGCVEGGDIERAAFAGLPMALRHRVIARYLQAHGAEPTNERVAELANFVVEAPTGRYGEGGCGIRLYAGRSHAALVDQEAREGETPSVPLTVPGETVALGRVFSIEYAETIPESPTTMCGPDCQVFDADRLAGALEVRTRRPGDRFSPLGMTGTRKIKDYFIGLGVPAPVRDAVPLVVDETGIVWVTGHAPAGRVCIGPQTARCLVVRVTRLGAEGSHAPE